MMATDWLTEEMNRQERAGIPNLDNVTDPDRIGAYGLEWDGDEDGPDPDVCADCDHQRAFHEPCLGLDCTCGEFIEPATA